MSNKKIEFIDLNAQQEILADKLTKAIGKVLAHGKYIMGPEVQELESVLSNFCGAKNTISCASGTDALLLALMALDVKPGDAVFVPSFTFVATAEVVALLGASPVFVDIDPDYFLMSIESLENAVGVARKAGLNPKVIIPVDLFGQPANYQLINSFANEHGLMVIADAAQSFGADDNDSKAGALATITTTSFFPAKPLGCYGDGGAIFTDDEKIAEKLRSLRVHGKGNDKYDNINVGINGRLDTLQAAILLVKMEVFAKEIEVRDEIAKRYSNLLDDIVSVPLVRKGCRSAWAQYTLKVNAREKVSKDLAEKGIPTAVYYPKPLHQQSAYMHFPSVDDLSNSESCSKNVLSIPMHPYMNEDTQSYIADALKDSVTE